MTSDLRAWAVEGIGEVSAGTDLTDLLTGVALQEGDVVLVTSKVVSKAEGRAAAEDREVAVAEETVRVVARRGATRIVENPLGLVMAAAGVDASNVTAGHIVRLPLDPDASARRLRESLAARRDLDVAVLVTDTAGRAWRAGQTELAVGVAGLLPLEDLSGRHDPYGNPLAVTAPAVADELACVAELVTGKLAARPVTVVRGLGVRVLPRGEHGPGATALLRPRAQDMFALGAREAVVAALAGTDGDCFGSPAPPPELLEALRACGLPARSEGEEVLVVAPGPDDPRVRLLVDALGHAHAWAVSVRPEGLALRPAGPGRSA